MKGFVEAGDKLTVIAAAAIASGAGLKVGSFVGVAQNSAAIGAPVTLQLQGVMKVAKAASQAWTVGQKIYWDDTAKNFTSTVGANTLVGAAFEAVAGGAGDIVGVVKLTGQVV
jgi:predicted RecA/RadA family phage recombinase